MARERKRPGPVDPAPKRARPRGGEQPELDLSDEELRALVDEGVDPEDLQRVARERRDPVEASEHDRDTARDDLEGLVADEDF